MLVDLQTARDNGSGAGWSAPILEILYTLAANMGRFLHPRYGTCALLLVVATPAAAMNVLRQVPRDALGLAVIRNLAEADAKTGKLLEFLGVRSAGPLALINSIAALDAGLDQRRDLLVVLLPPEDNARKIQLAVWLPVKNYDALVRSLDGDPDRRIAAVTVAGEDLLVVRQADWAVLMDPDQRDRLEALQSDASTEIPQQLDEWAEWINANDATLIALPAGVRALWAKAASEKLFDSGSNPSQPAPLENSPFAPIHQSKRAEAGWPAIREWIRATFSDAPELAKWAAEADGAACGVRLDADGNGIVGFRLAFSYAVFLPEAMMPAPESQATDNTGKLPPIFDAGEFVLTGSGHISPRWAVPAVAPYVRQMANDLTTNYGNKLQQGDVAKFRQAVEKTVADVRAFSVLTRPGAGPDGVFTNNFLVLRVGSAQSFVKAMGTVMELWNTMVDTAQGSVRLIFKVSPIAIAGHQGTEYSIDMAAAIGGPAIPEIKTSMEKLFGAGGEFRLQIVPMDDSTVLLSAATEAQVVHVIDVMEKQEIVTVEQPELRAAARLFTEQSDWQLFFSPHGYSEWLTRQMDAVLGAVLGGPVVTQFPASPPVGISGGVQGRMVWTEMVVPVKTIRGFGEYLRE